jgi:adenylate cyclase
LPPRAVIGTNREDDSRTCAKLRTAIRPGARDTCLVKSAKATMESTTRATVLFADISGTGSLYEAAGATKASEAIRQCLDRLRLAARLGGAQLVKTVGEEVMALFPTPAAAADAAAAMQAAVDALPEVAHSKLAVRIAFLSGPVSVKHGDVLGDTVKLTARLLAHAKQQQILTSSNTAAALDESYKPRMRDVARDGNAGQVRLCELVWGEDPDKTRIHAIRANALQHRLVRLKYATTEIVRQRGDTAIRIGRDFGGCLFVLDDHASRRHCTIEQRDGRFVLVDHSANGTFITEEGDPEIQLKGGDFPLRRHGWLAFGRPRVTTEQVVEYFCE